MVRGVYKGFTQSSSCLELTAIEYPVVVYRSPIQNPARQSHVSLEVAGCRLSQCNLLHFLRNAFLPLCLGASRVQGGISNNFNCNPGDHFAIAWPLSLYLGEGMTQKWILPGM